jgi:opine dehydrogenase
MKVAVLGGGNAAHAMAADLALSGHEVNMCELPQFADNIAAVKMLNGIQLTGKTAVAKEPGFAKLNLVTTDPAEAIKGVKVIMIAVPSFGQMAFLELFASALEDGQIIVLNPGYFGVLRYVKYLRDKGIDKDVIVVESECLVYATRLKGPAKAWIKAVKEKVGVATLPVSRMKEALPVLNELYPQFYAMENVFYTSLNNLNYIFHPASTLLNASRIEQMGPYKNQYYDVTPSIARVMTQIDNEKNEIAKALGLKPITAVEILKRYYGATGKDLYEALRNTYTYSIQTTPDSLKARYVSEDVPFGLVPMASLAKQLGTNNKALCTIIDLASLLNDTDYWETGSKLEDLGLEGMSSEEIMNYVVNG